jgi:hypothetical protein
LTRIKTECRIVHWNSSFCFNWIHLCLGYQKAVLAARKGGRRGRHVSEIQHRDPRNIYKKW